MNQPRIIKQLFAIFLMATFALSNTPTKYLHKLFANHKDYVNKSLKDSNTPQLSTSGINCHCETNVVIAPYAVQSQFTIRCFYKEFQNHKPAEIQKVILQATVSYGLRGPPSFV